MSKFRDFEKYEVYEDGRIWSYRKNKFLKPGIDTSGYQQVVLYDNEGKPKSYKVHRIVYESVTGEPIPKGYEINHRNEIKTSNMISNLELVSHKENVNYGTRTQRAAKSLTNNPKKSKAVGAFKDGELVMTFPSTQEAKRQGFEHSAVVMCCNGKKKTYKGYTWKYINEKET